MKKYKIILAVVVIGLCATFGVLANTTSVDAANNECSTGYTKKTYINKIGYEISGNTVSFTGAKGLMYSVSYDSSEVRNHIDNSGNFSITVPDEYASGKIVVTFYLDEDDGVCDGGIEVGGMEFYLDEASYNQLYNDSLCANYRSRWSNNKAMREAVPYCFTEYVSIQYSYNDVSSWVNDAERLYNLQQHGSSAIVQDPSYKNVDDVENTEKLVCDAFSNNNYETMHKYSHMQTNTVNNCTTTCKEEVEVNFSDPVATQAGLCFQYLIEIKSKVTCDSIYTAPMPSRPGVCVPTAFCEYSASSTSDKGGPSEDFDECVNQCDGGEYTQKCIDSCYTKVYGKDNTDTVTQTAFGEVGNSILTFDLNSTMFDGTDNAKLLANGCIDPKNAPYSQAADLYNQHQRDPGGYYEIVNGRTVWKKDNNSACPSDIGQYYFRSVDATLNTMHELRGDYSQGAGNKTYRANGEGILYRYLRNNHEDVCTDDCTWINNCSSNTVLTEYLAEQQYQQALAEYNSKKAACESGTAVCSNETTDYKIVVDNIDTNTSNGDDKEDFTSSQKLNSTNVTGAFPDMVILTDGSCEDGQSDPWNYHNIITFPGTWVNNKTGQTVHSMDPGHEDFYTYVGNEYCTKLNSVPINTAWYDWKVNQNGDQGALTDSRKNQISNNIDMNINGHIDNYGYFGWDFDVSCFYAIGSPEESCPPTDPNFPDCEGTPTPDDPVPDPDGPGGDPGDSPVNEYEFRSVALDNVFPSSTDEEREIGFNWTCAATNLENTDYLIQPVTVMNNIQALGDSIYDGEEYLDYHVRLTPETMRKVRNYNDDYDSYTEPTSDNSNEVLTAGNKKTAGITVYRSYLLHKVLNSNELLRSGVIGCNNEENGSCPRGTAAIDTTTSCYNEYMAQSAVLKGAN